ncbi:carbohydrate esterase family 8 protein [Gloeopeniophorella convolvens]|nr:carbohydrate esterase family 8 protein [Gloeopeniophorella convolvens]
MIYQFLQVLLLLAIPVLSLSPPASRTTPPPGALIVRAGTKTAGEFATLAAAVAALPDDKTSQAIFMFPGTYAGQVLIDREGPLTIFGFTTDAGNVNANVVNITASAPASTAGSDDASGTLRVHSDNVSLYNLNIRNDFGQGSQAIALSINGNQLGAYACGLFGFQDTLLTNEGVHVFLQGYIQGAVDFIFGQRSQAYFEGNTIAVSSKGCITADGRSSNDSGIYVLNRNTIILAPNPASGISGKIFLGRPWRDWARVVFKSTFITAPMAPAMWSEWSSSMPNTDHVFYAEFNSTGPGIPSNVARPSFSTLLSASAAAAFTLESTLGPASTSWVDADYLF